ncbi:hypothetical protein H257_18544 [Aphanomyces astaci]|uniref:Uncharacterized protein n=1 Tax=Aphanomyces astaci TaxID=112090 RepID=W4FD10_APHAT|nr:hypothetical protein H257_18544 [Aphanomyces astaci]ETV64578.1 hypothetical protein H257_18544 [Aphanomyces astaci]|eukprot:XP_009845934.1 hypothetical protein H257_18544 [Aphanomyces astaci]
MWCLWFRREVIHETTRLRLCAADIADYKSMLWCFSSPSLTLGPAAPSRRRLATNAYLKAVSDEL